MVSSQTKHIIALPIPQLEPLTDAGPRMVTIIESAVRHPVIPPPGPDGLVYIKHSVLSAWRPLPLRPALIWMEAGCDTKRQYWLLDYSASQTNPTLLRPPETIIPSQMSMFPPSLLPDAAFVGFGRAIWKRDSNDAKIMCVHYYAGGVEGEDAPLYREVNTHILADQLEGGSHSLCGTPCTISGQFLVSKEVHKVQSGLSYALLSFD